MEQKNKRDGAGPGRPRKDPNVWGQITCVLRRDTIQKLKEGCGGASKHFGAFLQDHLDHCPLPSRETYLFRQRLKAIQSNGRPSPERERLVRQLKREERDRLRWERQEARMTPKLRKAMAKVAKLIPGPEKTKAKAA